MVVFGGMGSYTGSVVAATGLTVVQFLMASLVEFRQLAYALLLIVMMIFKPSGMLGVKEFSLNRLLSHIPGWNAFADRMEALLVRRKAGVYRPGRAQIPLRRQEYAGIVSGTSGHPLRRPARGRRT